ncbi:MAG TPA: tryptophan 7-halogenase [Actinomycetota bacterium]|nr:tryptophan 7-halogenase [Actinomycetota bacterium]
MKQELAAGGARFDVVIAGGGPAGSAAALTLLRYTSLRVALVEESARSRPRAGEVLTPGAYPLLEYLGAAARFSGAGHRPSSGIESTWGSGSLSATDFVFNPLGHGWILARDRFDGALTDSVRDLGGVVLERASVQTVRRGRAATWNVHVRSEQGASVIRARSLIDATGRRAAIARRLGSGCVVADRLFAVAGTYRPGRSSTRASSTLVEPVPEGWWYQVRLPDDRFLVTLITDGTGVRSQGLPRTRAWRSLVERTTHVGRRIGDAVLDSEPHVAPASSQVSQPAAGPGWIAVGEAAAAFDPLSAMGLGYALYTGIAGARSAERHLVAGSDGLSETYSAEVSAHYRRYWARRSAYYKLERRWPGAPFWRTRHAFGADLPEGVTGVATELSSSDALRSTHAADDG